MPKVSKNELKDEVWQRMWQRLVKVIVEAKDRHKVEVLLSGLLTPAEEVMLCKRLMVGILSMSGWDVPEISSGLKMSKATVYKLKTYLEMNQSYRAFLQEVLPEKIERKRSGEKEIGLLEEMMGVIFEGYHDRWQFMDERNKRRRVYID